MQKVDEACRFSVPRATAQAAWCAGLLCCLFLLCPERAPAIGFERLESTFTDQTGRPALEAGSHPYAWTMSVAFDSTGPPSEPLPEGDLKDLRIALPPGLVAAPDEVPKCRRSEFLAGSCPAATVVGEAQLLVREAGSNIEDQVPVVQLVPLPGAPAEMGLTAQGIPLFFRLSLSPQPPYGGVIETRDVTRVASLLSYSLTLFGSPNGHPFLTLPRSCSGMQVGFFARSWEEPDTWATGTAPISAPVGCGSLSYAPTFRLATTTPAASSPSGLDVTLDAPDIGMVSAGGRAAADTRRVRLVLPAGMTVNPPIASGLAACTPAQLTSAATDSGPAAGCPEAAKIGTATVETPLFSDPIPGALYVAAPDVSSTAAPGAENPFDSLLALYLVLRDPERGLLLDVPIRIDADPTDGQLTATLEQLPELPLGHLELHFNHGPHAPLSTPSDCGGQALSYALSPSSGSPPLEDTDTITTSRNCPTSFAPVVNVGTTTNAAGHSAPLVAELTNPSTGPNLTGVRLSLPPGITADFAGDVCGQAAALTGACPPESRLGSAQVALGTGTDPLWVPGASDPDSAVFLAGPYQGAPYSLLIRLPAKAGPYDLGQVLLRGAITIDPHSARASVDFEHLPQILDGIPLHYRAIRLVIDRPGFIRNPTSCEPLSTSASVSASDGSRVELQSPFQAADCAALPFNPKVTLTLSGALARHGHPALHALMVGGSDEAAIAAAKFTLPRGELLDLRHVRALCSRRLPPQECPRSSRLGNVRLWSPALPDPLEGPFYLREPSGRLPDLLAELHSGQIRFVLHGHTAAPAGRLQLSFPSLPDVPLTRAVISLAGGRRGILVNGDSLCRSRARAEISLSAQSGKRKHLRPRLRLDGRC